MTLRACVCIPVFDNPLTICDVIQGSLQQTALPILVVDDGSKEDVERLYLTKYGPAPERLFFIRHDQNFGKGAALQSAFEWSLKKSFTHLITLDGDGQHYPTEIQKVHQAALENPWALIIGVRDMTHENVPSSSKFGRRFSNYWVQYQTKVRVLDSQSGFRCYPLFFVQTMTLFSKSYDFEAEVLTRLIWRGVKIIDITIKVYYPPGGTRVTHFRKFRDNAKITFIHISFIVLSLLRDHVSPLQSGLAAGIGVFVGCTPFFGVHFLIVAALAFLFRLNFIYMWVGSNISVPILMPFIILSSAGIGKFLLPQLSETSHWPLQWLVGSGVFGLGLGTLVGSTVYLIKKYRGRESKRTWTGKTRGGRFGNVFMKNLVGKYGVRAGYLFLFIIVPYFYLFSRKARRGSNEYWRVLMPELGFFSRQVKIFSQMYKFGQVLLDRAYQSQSREPKFMSADPIAIGNVRKATDKGNGVIILGMHAGGWDLAASLIRIHELNRKLYMILYDGNAEFLHTAKHKEDQQVQIIFHNREQNALLKIRDLLAQNNIIGMMGDRPMSQNFELVPLFGKLAMIDTTAFRVAALCKSAVVISFGFKEEDQSYLFVTEPPIWAAWAEGRSKEDLIFQWAQQFTMAMEKYLRRYPEQWFNYYGYWSEVPEFVLNMKLL